MLGELVGDLTGKITSTRIIRCHTRELKMEKTMESKGNVLGNDVTFIATFKAKEREQGGFYSEGNGILMLKNGEKAVLHGSGISTAHKGQTMSMRGIRYLQTRGGSLSRLNNVALVFEIEAGADGTITDKFWEWK